MIEDHILEEPVTISASPKTGTRVNKIVHHYAFPEYPESNEIGVAHIIDVRGYDPQVVPKLHKMVGDLERKYFQAAK